MLKAAAAIFMSTKAANILNWVAFVFTMEHWKNQLKAFPIWMLFNTMKIHVFAHEIMSLNTGNKTNQHTGKCIS